MEESLIIRKITIGDLKQGLTYQVGQRMKSGEIEVTAIIQDERTWIKNQQVVYDVYVKIKGEDVSRPWKRFFNQPTAIEYKIDIAKDYIVY
tara:strand:+ start:1031 stop:1303 length:273 start_codon:yes stop_codon:yes gene_type:complete